MLISYISSLRAFRLDMPLIFKQFSYFLLFVFLGDSFATAWPKWVYQHTPFIQSTHLFYNFFHLCMYSFYFYFFYRILQLPKLKRIVIGLCIVYLTFSLVNFSINGIMVVNGYNTVLASFIMGFLSIAYYYQLLTAREIVVLKNDVAFWITTGLLIYHLGSTMNLFFITIFESLAIYTHRIVNISTSVMHLTISIGYLCHNKTLSGKQ